MAFLAWFLGVLFFVSTACHLANLTSISVDVLGTGVFIMTVGWGIAIICLKEENNEP